MTNTQKALLAIFLFSIFSGANGAVTKIGLLNIPPFTFSLIRFLLASAAILPFHLAQKKISLIDLFRLTPLSLLGTANIIFYVSGLAHTTATSGQLLYAATPLLTALILFMVYGQQLSRQKLLGILIGFIGVTVVITLPIFGGNGYSGNFLGNVLIAIAVICWSLYMAFSQRLHQRFSPFALTLSFIYVTTIVLLPFSASEITNQFGWRTILNYSSALSLLYMSMVSTVGTYLLNQYAIKHGGSVFASLSLYLAPVAAYLSAYLLLGERLTVGLVIGGILAIIGVFLTSR